MILDSLWARLGALLYDPFLWLGERRGMAAQRRALLTGVSGRVLEVGAGTGLNLPFYDAGADVVLTEPDAAMRARLRRRGVDGRRRAGGGAPVRGRLVRRRGLDAGPVHVRDPVAAIGELRRVLRPGGRLLFIEHVRADDARRQDRWARLWRVFALGCRCNQPTLALLRAALDVRCEFALLARHALDRQPARDRRGAAMIAVALAGGGERVVAWEAGVLSGLRVRPDVVLGTSAGALVAARFAAGWAPHDDVVPGPHPADAFERLARVWEAAGATLQQRRRTLGRCALAASPGGEEAYRRPHRGPCAARVARRAADRGHRRRVRRAGDLRRR